MAVVALQACSSPASDFGTPDVSVGPSSDVDRSIREFVEIRAMVDFADSDLRVGYSYARTTHEPSVRQLAETLWRERLERRTPPRRGPA